MKSIKSKLYIIGLCAIFFAGGMLLNSSLQANPGGPGDPIVTRSYVDMRLNELIQTILSDLAVMLDDRDGTGLFAPIFVPGGHLLLGGEGTEIIMRGGAGTVYAPGEHGLTNVTSGTELFHGANVSLNNLILVPRADGRGIRFSIDSWLIIKGPHTILP